MTSRVDLPTLGENVTEALITRWLTCENPADAANAILGATLMAVLGRAMAQQDPTDPTFVHTIADQIVRGVLVPRSS